MIFIRTHEVIDFLQCKFKWYLGYVLGYQPEEHPMMSAMQFGTDVHEALARYYDYNKSVSAPNCYNGNDPLVKAMLDSYSNTVHDVPERTLAVEPEMHCDFTVRNHCVRYLMRPDAVVHIEQPIGEYVTPGIYLLEHKTRTELPRALTYLSIDTQRCSYDALFPLIAKDFIPELRSVNVESSFRGIMYNFLLKTSGDNRPVNERGEALNRDGMVSKRKRRNPIRRHLVPSIAPDRRRYRLQLYRNCRSIVSARCSAEEHSHEDNLDRFAKSPRESCAYNCPLFAACSIHQVHGDIEGVLEAYYVQGDPYEGYGT